MKGKKTKSHLCLFPTSSSLRQDVRWYRYKLNNYFAPNNCGLAIKLGDIIQNNTLHCNYELTKYAT